MEAIESFPNAVLKLPAKPEQNRHDKRIIKKKKDIDLSSDFFITVLTVPHCSFMIFDVKSVLVKIYCVKLFL